MCGVLITWCIGRNNNGPIGADNPVRGQAVNTRVVKLLPVEAKDDRRVTDGKQDGDGRLEGKIQSSSPKVRIREDGRTVIRVGDKKPSKIQNHHLIQTSFSMG